MDEAGRQLLAAAGFAGDVNRRLAAGQLGDDLPHRAHGPGIAEQLQGLAAGHPLGCGCHRQIDGRLDQGTQLIQGHRLGQIVEGPGLEGRHRVLGAAKGGDHGHRRLAVLLADEAHQFQPFPIGQTHVGQAQLVRLPGKELPSLGHGAGAIRRQPHARQGEVHQFPDIRFVIHHQHPGQRPPGAAFTFGLSHALSFPLF